MRLTSLALAMLLVSAGSTASARDDPLFDKRWASLLAGGYEPLTIPTDWYDPVAEIEGDERAFEMAIPQDAGISTTALAAAAAWAEAQNSTALIVARDGKIVFERYWQGTRRDTRFNPQSMSKTITALLVGQAVERGEIASVDAPIGDYLPQWQGDPRGRITIRQMLWMASGLEQGDDGFGYAVTPYNPIVRHSLGNDFTQRLLTLELTAQPGSRFDYNNQVNQLLGLALENASGMDYETLIAQRIWQPLGLRSAAIPLDRPGGLALTSCCILSRPIDWTRIGGLFLAGGSSVIAADWLNEMRQPSPAYAGYGYQLWIGNQTVGGEPQNRPGLVPWQSEPFAAPEMVLLHGHGGQRTYVMPDKGLVIVRAARDWPDAWDDAVLPNIIWRGAT